ncbi:MAG TPA: hypothetical protein VFU21_10015 [Kofleriaceae bacterium]|nr:hypothetical protein [Kofleriaceae bacterium]
MRRAWPHVRAGLVALAILVGLIDGCPIPSAKSVSPRWSDRVRTWARTRRIVMTPFKPVGELLRLRQTWKLFPTAKLDQHRMWVDARKTGTKDQWELLYRPHDPDHDLHADRIEYRRLRGVWNPGTKGTRTGYGPFVEWLAGEIFEARADVDRIRVRQERIAIEPEEGGFVPSGKFELEKSQGRARWERRREKEAARGRTGGGS